MGMFETTGREHGRYPLNLGAYNEVVCGRT